MKKSVVILLALLFTVQFVSAQKIDSSLNRSGQVSNDFYKQKYRTNNTIAWCLLAPGVAVMSAGAITIGSTNPFQRAYTNDHSGEALVYIGGAMALTSIPFFIMAHSNKRNANLSLKREKTAMMSNGTGSINYIALALKIKF